MMTGILLAAALNETTSSKGSETAHTVSKTELRARKVSRMFDGIDKKRCTCVFDYTMSYSFIAKVFFWILCVVSNRSEAPTFYPQEGSSV